MVDGTKDRGRNSSTVDASRNAKRVPGGTGKFPVANNAGGEQIFNKLDKNNKK
jgi:hypothetical protein